MYNTFVDLNNDYDSFKKDLIEVFGNVKEFGINKPFDASDINDKGLSNNIILLRIHALDYQDIKLISNEIFKIQANNNTFLYMETDNRTLRKDEVYINEFNNKAIVKLRDYCGSHRVSSVYSNSFGGHIFSTIPPFPWIDADNVFVVYNYDELIPIKNRSGMFQTNLIYDKNCIYPKLKQTK